MAGVQLGSVCNVGVNDCWVVGLERFAVGPDEDDEEFYEIRAEWSDKSITYLRRRSHDLVKLVKNLRKSFPEDRGSLPQSLLLEALQKIKEAEENHDIETRLDEVEKLLRITIKMPQKYSQSEAVLAFFKSSPLDNTLKTMYEPVQPLYQSPVTAADVRRANGFCLANTETVLYDSYILEKGVKASPVCSSKYSSEIEAQTWTGTRFQNGIRHDKETVHKPHRSPVLTPGAVECKEADYRPKKSQNTTHNLTYFHLQACETDILE